ncbi:hypothetical protein [Streptomyces sp. NPDC058092]|uniref:hypothetical protein n=1 Tax=Streptomyces sp. NPDC058092 TaxID=3346336 RepID=UPI0036E52A1E
MVRATCSIFSGNPFNGWGASSKVRLSLFSCLVLLHADDQGAAVDGERGQVARQLLVAALAVRGLLQVQMMAFLEQAAIDGGLEVNLYAGKSPSVASLYRALAEAGQTAEDDHLPLRPEPVRIRQPEDPLTLEEIDLRDRLQTQPHPNATGPRG